MPPEVLHIKHSLKSILVKSARTNGIYNSLQISSTTWIVTELRTSVLGV